MNKKISAFVTLAVTVWVGNFVIDFIMMKIDPYLQGKNLYTTVAIKLLTSVVVFYPVFGLLDVYVRNLSEAFIKSTKEISGKALLGTILSLILAFILVFLGYITVIHKGKLF